MSIESPEVPPHRRQKKKRQIIVETRYTDSTFWRLLPRYLEWHLHGRYERLDDALKAIEDLKRRRPNQEWRLKTHE